MTDDEVFEVQQAYIRLRADIGDLPWSKPSDSLPSLSPVAIEFLTATAALNAVAASAEQASARGGILNLFRVLLSVPRFRMARTRSLRAYRAYKDSLTQDRITAPSTGSKAEQLAESVERIVQGYARFHEVNVPAPGCVTDASCLPYPKATIKTAIVAALRLTDDEEIKGALRTVYLDLAHWQDGVGSAAQGIDLTELDLDDDSRKLADAVLAMAPGHQRWARVLEAETHLLATELQAQGLW